LVQNSRYTDDTQGVGSLVVPTAIYQGITVRPVPCNYNVIQSVSALSRRKRGFKSRRGRQINSLGGDTSTLCLTSGSESLGSVTIHD